MGEFAGSGLACVRGERLLFADLSFRLPAGDALVLEGPNGSGKSSLLRLMAGLAAPIEGSLTWDGRPVADDPEGHRGRLRFLGHADAVKPALTAVENVAFWGALGRVEDPPAAARIALDWLGLADLADLPARYLSQGQRRRVALARLQMGEAPLWLLDEPTVGLDAGAVALVEGLIAAHRARGGSVVVTTHVPIALPGAGRMTLGAPADAMDAES